MGEAQDTLDRAGIDRVCHRILEGETLTAIAKHYGVSIGSLIAWVGTPERSARVNEARAEAATLWDEAATDRIDDASDDFELEKAKQLAHHYRWRASKIAPKRYGDRVHQDVDIKINDALADRLAKAQQLALPTPIPKDPI